MLPGQNAVAPLNIDDPVLTGLAREGHRWVRGQAGLVQYRWLVPPTFVLAGELPEPPPGGLVHLCGGGDREGRLTAVLGFARGIAAPPLALVGRDQGSVTSLAAFRSRTADVAERIEFRDGKCIVTAVHAVMAGSEPYRFFAAAVGRVDNDGQRDQLRTMAVALSFADLSEAHQRGRINA
jgi:hypothetical protein